MSFDNRKKNKFNFSFIIYLCVMRRFLTIKMGPARSKEWTCCFGLHVRTATIMIGVWHLVCKLKFLTDKRNWFFNFNYALFYIWISWAFNHLHFVIVSYPLDFHACPRYIRDFFHLFLIVLSQLQVLVLKL